MFSDNEKVLVLKFLGMKNMIFFEPKSWWKDDIYWLRKSSCFELFGGGKYSLFSAKKLMERWYLLGFFSFPWYSGTLGNAVFRAVLVRSNISHTSKFCQCHFDHLLNYQCVRFSWSRTTNYQNSVRMIRYIWPFFIVFFVIFVCNTV